MTVGSTTRFRKRLTRIRFLGDKDHIAQGFDLAIRAFSSEEQLVLLIADGQPVAWSHQDPVIYRRPVELSHHMSTSKADIAESHLDPSGSPSFDVFIHKDINDNSSGDRPFCAAKSAHSATSYSLRRPAQDEACRCMAANASP